jgi:hypothetical protein
LPESNCCLFLFIVSLSFLDWSCPGSSYLKASSTIIHLVHLQCFFFEVWWFGWVWLSRYFPSLPRTFLYQSNKLNIFCILIKCRPKGPKSPPCKRSFYFPSVHGFCKQFNCTFIIDNHVTFCNFGCTATHFLDRSSWQACQQSK